MPKGSHRDGGIAVSCVVTAIAGYNLRGCGDGQSRFGEQPELARPTNRRHGVLPAARSPRAENSVRTAQAAATPMRTRVRELREDSFAWWWWRRGCLPVWLRGGINLSAVELAAET